MRRSNKEIRDTAVNMDVAIRHATASDLPGLLDIQKAAFARYTEFLAPGQIPPLNETIAGVRSDFNDKQILVADFRGILSGSIRYLIKGGVCLIERLSVHPDYQGNGMGRALVSEVEEHAKGNAHKIYLETGLLAHNLLTFYTRLGYSGEAILRKHYGGFDWIVFSKFI